MSCPTPEDAAGSNDPDSHRDDSKAAGAESADASNEESGQPWYRDGIRFECQGTGKCCTARGEYGHVYLEDDEAKAAAALMEMTLTEFEDTFCHFEDGERELRFRNGACVFLDGHQCGVYEARPLQCRTWPFWPENLEKKAWDRDVAPFCAGVGKGRVYSTAEIETIAGSLEEDR